MLGGTGLLPQATFAGPTNSKPLHDNKHGLVGIPASTLLCRVQNSTNLLGCWCWRICAVWCLARVNENWTGRNLALRTYLQTITFNPVVSYALFDNRVSIAADSRILLVRELRQRIPNFGTEPFLNLKGPARIFHGMRALLLNRKGLKIGAAYRNNINMKYDGKLPSQRMPQEHRHFLFT